MITRLEDHTKPQEPVFWYAQFPENFGDKVTIEENEISLFPRQEGEHTFPLLFQYDNTGTTTCSFSSLPKQPLTHFGLINSVTQDVYTIDLKTGIFLINGVRFGITVPRNVDPMIVSGFHLTNRDHTRLSERMDSYHDTFFYKKHVKGRMISPKTKIDPKDMAAARKLMNPIENYSIGYTVKANGKEYIASITVDTADFTPLVGINLISSE